jgi:hypothetical protein
MGKILKFRSKNIRPVVVSDSPKHRIHVEILATRNRRQLRWLVQMEIQDVAGFKANLGFTDEAVAEGHRHRFRVTSTEAVRQFVARTFGLVSSQQIAVWVDGKRVRPLVVDQVA